jgi:hypothetical protein
MASLESQNSRPDTGGRLGGSLPRAAPVTPSGLAALQNSLDDSWGYDGGMEGDADDSESVMTDLLSPGGQTDAQTLACMLQVPYFF